MNEIFGRVYSANFRSWIHLWNVVVFQRNLDLSYESNNVSLSVNKQTVLLVWMREPDATPHSQVVWRVVGVTACREASMASFLQSLHSQQCVKLVLNFVDVVKSLETRGNGLLL